MAEQNGRERASESMDGHRPLGRASSVSLLEVEPELGPLLAGEQLDQAGRFALPACTVEGGADVIGTLNDTDAFGAIVLDGLLLHGTQIGERPALRLVEPGDVVPFTRDTSAVPLATVSVRAATRSRIVLLDGHFLVAAQRWPQLTALVYRRAGDSSGRLATQLAISHLSRVDERLMSVMWLLADTWGHVTNSGIRLRLTLTHDALGELVGARRSTVTLALKELAKRGSLIRQADCWLILDPPPEPRTVELEPPRLIDAPRPGSAWSSPAQSERQDARLALLQTELARLRQKYAPDRELAQDLADEARQLRARTHELVFDAHLLTDVTHQERAATRSAGKTSRDPLDGPGEKQDRAT
jgi:CRP-like cAMP-binding protein